MARDEDELIGIHPRQPGEDPRFGGSSDGIDLVDNGAFTEIENLADDLADPVDVDEDPYISHATDDDGVPGYRPFVDASKTFEQQEGLEPEDDNSEDSDEQVLGDDFAQHIQRRTDAAVGDDGRPVSDIAMLASAQHAQNQATLGDTKYVRINPESAYSGLLGGRSTVQPGMAPVQVVNWVGRDDTEALPVTVTLNPLTKFAVGAPNSFRGYAEITWGTRDGVQTVKVDVGSGCQLTVVASTLYVSVGLDDSADTAIELSASIGFYTCVRPTPLTYTSYLSDQLVAGQTTLVRPAFASHIDFYTIVPIGAPAMVFNLYFVGQADEIAYTKHLTATAGNSIFTTDSIKLSNDIVAVIVENVSGGTTTSRFIWGLHL